MRSLLRSLVVVSIVIIFIGDFFLVQSFVAVHHTSKISQHAVSSGIMRLKMSEVASPAPVAVDKEALKRQILQLGAALDRGQAHNPTSGEYYGDKLRFAKAKVAALAEQAPPAPTSLAEIGGEWELVLATVPHGIFRSSPFFLAIQEAYAAGGQPEKAELFFKLHELQTCSWGASKIGRVAQVIDAENQTFISEFDTSIFSLTVIPVLGWFKLLPTFGGRVTTVSKVLRLREGGWLDLEVDYTTGAEVPGLNGLADWIWGLKVPVGAVWKLLPWNQGRAATATLRVAYSDGDFRIMEDSDGEFFVYTRPVYIEPPSTDNKLAAAAEE
mmetsp:Transcript_6958/g.11220  ORF Transcript_6958/g.11220 Transcript_6958/m.11220 type:complete len:327 (+) Transcript_6958:79-1059(+)